MRRGKKIEMRRWDKESKGHRSKGRERKREREEKEDNRGRKIE